jgi:hypothetical protein
MAAGDYRQQHGQYHFDLMHLLSLPVIFTARKFNVSGGFVERNLRGVSANGHLFIAFSLFFGRRETEGERAERGKIRPSAQLHATGA